MKGNRFLSTMLASALTVTSVLPSMAVAAAEEDVNLADHLVADYNFDDETVTNQVAGGSQATAIVRGLGAYSGSMTYADGKNGKGLQLGSYGLKLNQQNLGDEFTVSLWLKPTGTINNNGNVVFLGYHNPEKWYSLAGRDSNNRVKIWAKDAVNNVYSWTEFASGINLGTSWHSVVITGTSEKMTAYLDGTQITENAAFGVLSGANQDIYLGANNWDPNFPGIIDDVKVYDVALTLEQVQEPMKDELQAAFQTKVDAALTVDSLLGMNSSAQEVYYDLNLPETVAGGSVTWASSNEAVLAADGTVASPKKDTEVTMTATVKSGILSVEKQFTFTAKAIDRSAIDALIEKAEAIDKTNYAEAAVAALDEAIATAKAASTKLACEEATEELYAAIAGLAGGMTDESSVQVRKAASKLVLKVNEKRAFVEAESEEVTYTTSDESVVAIEDGKAVGKAAGKAEVTAVIGGKMTVVVPVEVLAGTEGPLTIKESEINKLLTGDLSLPTSISGTDATITYSVDEADAKYVTLEGNTLKITRPYAGEGNYAFILKAKVETAEGTFDQEFKLTIAEGIADDSKAGYVYVCFGNEGGADIQQLFMFVSEDGLNWTALNGFNPLFEAGKDHTDKIEAVSTHNYKIKDGTDITETVKGDVSVLFPFEGNDQGIRDPYVFRGAREEDKNKIWIVATDLNTMAPKYGGNLTNNVVGNWGTMSSQGSTSIFVYETEDWINWERRYVDLGTEIGAGAAWAPEFIYNPEKDNYLVYWSCRVKIDGLARNRIYCNETKDFKTFGPTKLYEQEAFYQKWGKLVNANDGYGNIDTSQIWVEDENGDPYGTVFRVVKDETNNHIELMKSDTVLDPTIPYDLTDPIGIVPYEKNGKTYSTNADTSGLNDYEKADVVWNWFKGQAVGNHFEYVQQSSMEAKAGAYEGATMFKFNDRDEWCVMIDYYGNNNTRYEPYTTTDLSVPNSIKKVASGYGRTGGDVGCHGGMMPISAEEYNTLVSMYNSDTSVDGYHTIEEISGDKRPVEDKIAELEEALKDETLTDSQKAQLEEKLFIAESMMEVPLVDAKAINSLSADVKDDQTKPEIKFVDVNDGDWFNDPVYYVANAGIMTGLDETHFGPNEPLMRAQLAVILWRLEGKPAVETALTFADVSEKNDGNGWYYDAVAWAVEKGIITGYTDTNTFKPAKEISRQEIATMMHRYAKLKNKDGGAEDYSSFPDADKVAGYAKDAMEWAVGNGIITGKSGNLAPEDSAVRAQAATIIMRYMEMK